MTDEPIEKTERVAEPTAAPAAPATQANQARPLSSGQRVQLAIAAITVAGTVVVAVVGIAGPWMQHIAERSNGLDVQHRSRNWPRGNLVQLRVRVLTHPRYAS